MERVAELRAQRQEQWTHLVSYVKTSIERLGPLKKKSARDKWISGFLSGFDEIVGQLENVDVRLDSCVDQSNCPRASPSPELPDWESSVPPDPEWEEIHRMWFAPERISEVIDSKITMRQSKSK